MMRMTFRWFGPTDPIPLAYIRQIPGIVGIVSALYDVPVGDTWPRESLAALKSEVEAAGLELAVVESIPVHEDIKLGRPGRDRHGLLCPGDTCTAVWGVYVMPHYVLVSDLNSGLWVVNRPR